jgi:acetoin utilization deacetylase AcuC-like enzyme
MYRNLYFMKPLAIFTDTDFADRHDTGYGHPECGDRILKIQSMLEHHFSGFLESCYPADDSKLLLAHPQSHIDSVMNALPFEGYASIDGDTILSSNSFDTALLAVGASCQAVDTVLKNESQTAFVAVRPPGHHAEYDKAMGFCLFNNAFIAAHHANCRVLIIDFDVHHGNGTEDLVKRHIQNGSTNIAYASTHQAPFWPHTGQKNLENVCNCPLPSGTNSEQFRKTFMDEIIPFAQNFKPELIIFSAGFDGHKDDPLAELELEEQDYAWIVHVTQTVCTKIVSILEGGYNLDTLPNLVKIHLKALSQGA